MKLPRNVSGKHLAKLLEKYGYAITRQSGSHLRLTTLQNGEHHITIPLHKDLRVGTLHMIISDVADHFEIDLESFAQDIFG